MSFAKGFGDYVCHGDTITCEVDGITYTARLEQDTDTQIEDFACYEEPEIEAWKRDEWHYYGVVIDAEIEGWQRSDIVSLWAVEGNYPGGDNSHMLEVANDLLPEAIEVVKASLGRVAA